MERGVTIIIIALILVIIIGAGAYIYLTNQSPSQENNDNSTIQTTQNNTFPANIQQPTLNNQSPVLIPKIYNVEIKDYAFSPSTITIKKGDSIKWTNQDSVGHTATSDNSLFDSGTLNKNKDYTFTFNQAGTFNYHCTPHPYMKGKIIVE